ncbi:hypothetical protein D3C76_1751230 [compost metagenome]
MVPQSLALRLRLIADMTSPPRNPITTITRDINNDCQKLKGVIQYMQPPISVADSPPPTRPSTVFDGLTSGATLRLPKSLPKTYCNTSLS